MSPQEIVELALHSGSRVVTSTYNEPLITSEWAVEIFQLARSRGLVTSYVSNGNGTQEVIDFIRLHVDLYKIDLKGFRDKAYRELGGVLANVLRTIEDVYRRGFWLEVVTLIVPGLNDDPLELKDLAGFLASVSPDIPWHATAFHPDYKMQDRDRTPVETLLQAAEIAKEAGLRYVYLGNLPGQVGPWENTYCPNCGEELIRRYGFRILSNRLKAGQCPACTTAIPGFWGP